MSLEEDLDCIYDNVIHLIYRQCACLSRGDCEGNLKVVNLISKRNKYFRWDLNNGILMCEAHASWWSDGGQEPYQFLTTINPKAIQFHLDNQDLELKDKPNLNALARFLHETKLGAIRSKNAPFPSLYGKLQ